MCQVDRLKCQFRRSVYFLRKSTLQRVTKDIRTSVYWNKSEYVTIQPPPFEGGLNRQAISLKIVYIKSWKRTSVLVQLFVF